LNWTDNATNETGFQIYRSANGGAYNLRGTVGANVVTYTDTVSVGNTYAYQVRAYNVAGNSAFAGPASVTIVGIPAAPTGLTATQVPQTFMVSLAWTDNANNETGFQIYRSANGGAYTLRGTVGANVVTFTDAVSGGNTYAYQVRSYNVAGNSAFAGPASVTIVNLPAAPTGLAAVKSTATTVTVTWTDNATNETGYQVYRSANGGAYNLRATLGANAVSYIDQVSAGNTYSYQVRAYNISGYSAFAGPVAVAV
jgi:hypothetical protein